VLDIEELFYVRISSSLVTVIWQVIIRLGMSIFRKLIHLIIK